MAQFFTPLDTQSFDSLASLIRANREEARLKPLRDIQLQEAQLRLADLQRTQDQDAELRNNIRLAQPRTVTSMMPSLADIGGVPGGQFIAGERVSNPIPSSSLGDLMPGSARLRIQQPEPFRMQQPQASPLVQAYHDGRVSTKTEQPNYGQIAYETRMKQGRMEDALKAISMDDKIAEYGARIQAGGGDLRQYHAAKQELDTSKAFLDDLANFSKTPDMLKVAWPMLTRAYPNQTKGITPDMLKSDENLGVLFPMTDQTGRHVPGKYWYKDPSDGKMKMVDDGTAKEAAMERRMERQIQAADDRQARAIAAADARAAAKGQTPGKPLPAGQLESIADMKRVKDVLAEAGAAVDAGGVATGPVKGRLQSAGAMVGLADDKFVDVQQKLQTAQNIMLKLRSGAAVTESEYSRFLKEFPTPNDPPEVFKRKMGNAVNYANTLMDDKINIYEEGGYRVPRQTTQSTKPAATSPAPPKPGQVVKGYRFKGGDPSNKANWVKQ